MKRNPLSAALLAAACVSLSFAAGAQAAVQQQSSQSTAMQSSNAQGQFATVAGDKIHYQVSGQGQPLLLIHGYPLNGNLFAKQRQSLSRNFKVITPDLPGFGQSTTAQNTKGSLQMYAKAMFGLMDQLGIKKAVIGGHSMGGMTAIEMYKEQPNRFAGLILIDTAAASAPIPRKDLWQGYAQLAQQKSDHTKTMENLLIPNMLTFKTRSNDPQTVNDMKQMIEAASKAGIVQGGQALADRPDNSSVLGQVNVPTLILVGSEDTITPPWIAEKMHDAIKGSKLAVIQGGSHAEILASSQQANQAIMNWVQQSPQLASTTH